MPFYASRVQRAATALLAVSVLLDSALAHAVPYYWDINGPTLGAGGPTPSGAWNGTNTFWNTDSTGGAGTFVANPTTSDALTFSAGSDATGSYTVTLSGTRSSGNLTFEDGSATLTGGTLALPNANTSITVNSSTARIDSAMTGLSGVTLTKNGTGKLIFGGTHSSGSNLSVTAGEFEVASGGSYSNAGQYWIGNSGGAGALTVSGGTLNASGATPTAFTLGNNGAGTFNFSSGTVNVGGSGSGVILGNAASSPVAWNQTGGTFNHTANQGFFIANIAGGASTMNISGGSIVKTQGIMYLGVRDTATMTISGTGLVSVPTLQFGHSSGTAATRTLNLDAGGTLQANAITHVQGTSNFNFNGGTLRAGAAVTLMSGLSSAKVESGGAVIDTNGFNVTISQALLAGSPSGGLTKNGLGTLTLSSNANTYTGATTINAGTLQVTGGVGSINSASAINVTSSGTLTYTLNGATIANNVSGSGVWNLNTVSGSGVHGFSLTGGNSGFTGTLNVGSGTRWTVGTGFTTTAGQPAASAALNVTNGGTLWIRSGAATMNHAITIYGDGVSEGSPGPYGALRVDNNGVYGGNVTLGSNARIGGAGAGAGGTLSGNLLIGGNTLTLNPTNSNLTFSGAITSSNAGAINKIGNLSVVFTGNNSGFTGVYTNSTSNTYLRSVNAGSAAAAWVVNAGNLYSDVSGTVTQHLGSLAGTGGGLTNNTGGTATFSIGALNTSTSYSGVISNGSGATAVTKVGSGTLTLAGSNTYTGATTINAGTLSVADVANNGAASQIGQGTSLVFGGGTLAFTGAGADATNRTVTLNSAGGTVDITQAAGNLTLSGVLSGPGGLTKKGAGTLTLTAVDGYNGPTLVDAGALVLSHASSNNLLGTSDVLVGSGATLNVSGLAGAGTSDWILASGQAIGGHGTVVGNVTVSSGATLTPGSSPGTITFTGDLAIDPGATYAFEGSDLTIVLGTLTLGNASLSNWTLALGSQLLDGGSIVLFDYGALAANFDLTPTFDLTNLGFTPSGPLSLVNDTAKKQIVLLGVSTAVPEPSTCLLLALGSAGLGLVARRRRSAV